MSRRDKKEDEDGPAKMYRNLDKTSLIQEAKYFNSSPVNPRKCIKILTKIIYMLNQGEQLTTQEATDTFFATTKLFQSKDIVLRRLVYLCIKELSPIAQDVIIVTSSLTKDMTGNQDLFRAAAIRALCSITDNTMLQAIERYMKQAIVDKNPAVSSAALVSAVHLSNSVPDLVRRWVNEAQEAIISDHAMVSYHALGLVAGARRNDRLSTVKLITKMSRAHLRSPFALCLLIRHAAMLAEEEDTTGTYYDFIESCLRHKSEMVVYEAAHALINSNKVTGVTLKHAVSVLQIFCASSKPTMRLAGARTLAKLTEKHPHAVADCAVDLENLISDSNRSVATLAVTTLLATGAESSVDRLMKQIAGFLSDIPDEFKIIVVQAIRRLCSKFPRKYHSLAAFLAGMLREEGGVQYKTAIAEAIIALVQENPDAKEIGLAHLCEFIEDCEHTSLAVRILNVLAMEGPKARQPSRYIRFVYNRVVLESGAVRAEAVTTLARFGATRPELLDNIKVLLHRIQLDDEDEVRDRAVFYAMILESGDAQLINDMILDVRVPNPALLEKAIADHINSGSEELFNIDSVPLEEDTKEEQGAAAAAIVTQKVQSISREERYAEELKEITGIEKLGPLFKTCESVDLTEPETEYQVRVVKHIYSRHLVLQFECLNTLSTMLLEQVYIRLDCLPGYQVVNDIPCRELPYNRQGNIFLVLKFPENTMESLGSFGATLEFVCQDCDPATGLPDGSDGYSDTYPLEDVEVGCADQFRFRAPSDDWEGMWGRAASAFESSDTFGLSQSGVAEAATAVCDHLGLPKAAVTGDAVREIRGVGLFRGGVPILIRARLVAAQGAVTMQLTVRSPHEAVATLLLAAVG